MEQGSEMNSYFLAETLKYMYLIFDEENWANDDSYIFTTEGLVMDLLEFGRTLQFVTQVTFSRSMFHPI
jgi:hypothetical protein